LQLIVNADDFGLSEDSVAATIECFEAGALTSATIMPSVPATDRALAYALEHPELGFGVHLTFTGEKGSRPLAHVPGLTGRDGRFLSPRAVRARALSGRLDPGQIAREIEAQVRAVRDAGVEVSHVDSHRHLHKFAPFREALARALPGLGIRRVRSVQDVYLEGSPLSPTYWLGRRWRRRIRDRFETTDHFFMAGKKDAPWTRALLARLDRLGPGSLEVGVHPGREEPWRDRERACVLELAAELGDTVSLVSWRTLEPRR
jgi:predicted glycoside hydrolase/deacetylase ChbG (UPF0249 family)